MCLLALNQVPFLRFNWKSTKEVLHFYLLVITFEVFHIFSKNFLMSSISVLSSSSVNPAIWTFLDLHMLLGWTPLSWSLCFCTELHDHMFLFHYTVGIWLHSIIYTFFAFSEMISFIIVFYLWRCYFHFTYVYYRLFVE